MKVAMRDFCIFTIMNINSGDLKLSGNPERMRRWRDLKDRVEPCIKADKTKPPPSSHANAEA